eukprot:191366-Lingulodinium_polyedra.AAC.1
MPLDASFAPFARRFPPSARRRVARKASRCAACPLVSSSNSEGAVRAQRAGGKAVYGLGEGKRTTQLTPARPSVPAASWTEREERGPCVLRSRSPDGPPPPGQACWRQYAGRQGRPADVPGFLR